MSTATAPKAAVAAAAEAAPARAPKGKKKLILILAAALLVVAAGGGTAVVLMKQRAAAAEAESDIAGDDDEASPKAAKVAKSAPKHDPKAIPTFVPLDAFTVNLADRDAERYAQVGITLELEDAELADRIKAFMPAIRNHILLAIADRTAAELLDREGKAALAEKVRRETSRVLGHDVGEADERPAAGDAGSPAKKKAKKPAEPLPIKAVHFSNFIVQ